MTPVSQALQGLDVRARPSYTFRLKAAALTSAERFPSNKFIRGSRTAGRRLHNNGETGVQEEKRGGGCTAASPSGKGEPPSSGRLQDRRNHIRRNRIYARSQINHRAPR